VTVAVVGDGPAVESVRAALEDVNAPVEVTAVSGVRDADLAVVVGVAGAGGFAAANDAARDAGTPLVTVEVGGLGGHPLPDVEAGVSLLTSEGPCFECLAARVASTGQEPADSPSADRAAVRLAGAHAGRLAADALRGEAAPGTVLELPYARRSLAPAPNCECGGEAPDHAPRRDARERSLDDALAAAEPLVDDRLGLLTLVGERESFPAPYYLASVADTTPFSDASGADQAAGVDADWNAAYMKAVGEGLERYSAGVYREDEFESAPVDQEAAVQPATFVRPDGASTPAGLEWIRGEDLQSGEEALLPADRVVFPPPDWSTGPSITTGLGLGNSSVQALCSGLYETVERDATMLAWYSTFDPLGLAVEDPEFDELERRAGAEDLEVTALLCTQDVDVPVVAVAVHRDEWPKFAVGSAADLDPEAAATGALAEALQNWMELRAMGPEDASEEDGAIGKYADFPPAVQGFVDPETTIPAAEVGSENPPTGADELDAILDALGDADLDAYAARLTTRDLERAGFESVRVLVPEAQPLFVDQPFFGDRAESVPEQLGFEPDLDREFHPFP
jgi:ribosomal protein S12 methylthiotransferase accessory factor